MRINIEKMKTGKITFNEWLHEARWNTTRLAKEFAKYGHKVSPSAIWYWKKGQYTPRDKKTMDILSDICGFPASHFDNFKKK